MSDHTAAMGLPEGSIRAIIALLLVTLFFISALFLYLNVAEGPQRGPARTLQGITAQQLAALPAADIDGVTPRIVGTATVYDVTLAGRLPDRSRADDIAAQLVTTVGTLVTAVAAFYFGANSVQTARSRESKETRDLQLMTSGQGRTRDQVAAISDAGARDQAETAGGQAEMTGGQAETAVEVPP